MSLVLFKFLEKKAWRVYVLCFRVENTWELICVRDAGVDKVLDLYDINVPSGSVGTVLCLETLELWYPRKALEEIHRILKPDGIAVISRSGSWSQLA